MIKDTDSQFNKAWAIVIQKQFLSLIKNNKKNDQLSNLRRKIAEKFDRNLAYQLLVYSSSLQGVDELDNYFNVDLPSRVHLTPREQQTLLELIRSVYGSHVKGLVIKTTASSGATANKNSEVK